jgi:hypothetical protein
MTARTTYPKLAQLAPGNRVTDREAHDALDEIDRLRQQTAGAVPLDEHYARLGAVTEAVAVGVALYDLTADDVFVVRLDRDFPPAAMEKIAEGLNGALPCKVLVVSDGIADVELHRAIEQAAPPLRVEVGGVMWCTTHHGVVDECSSDQETCDMGDVDLEACEIVPLFIEAAS